MTASPATATMKRFVKCFFYFIDAFSLTGQENQCKQVNKSKMSRLLSTTITVSDIIQ